MTWNWQSLKWPNFRWDEKKLAKAERIFNAEAGIVIGASHHLDPSKKETLLIEIMSLEAVDTSKIEGENLNRESVQSSIRRQLGLSSERTRVTPLEQGISEMMISLHQTINQPLSASILKQWHAMLMQQREDLENIGEYRTHAEAMQIVSGPDYKRTIHFEAPPSARVEKEMKQFIRWFNESAPNQEKALPNVTRAGLAHIWFESIHPFEDGNGRLGRAISEKALSQNAHKPVMTSLAKILLKRRKRYYQQLNTASKSLEMTDWLLWFAAAAIEAQRYTLSYVDFVIEQSKMMQSLAHQLNDRQQKVLLRLFREGPDGFTGGLSAANYHSLTGASSATTTRDLQDLVKKGALVRTGERKATRYHLAIDTKPVKPVHIEDIL